MEVPVFKFVLNYGLDDKFLPTKANITDTGWDVRSTIDLIIKPGEYVKIPLGFRVFAPEGWWLELRPRSSTFAKKQLHALYGVIDNTFEGQNIFAAQYLPDNMSYLNTLKIKVGDAIGQFIPFEIKEMKIEKISNEEFEGLCKERNAPRGVGGFGSSDVKK